jgi:AAA+ ATPase superfamily predicted ATPase
VADFLNRRREVSRLEESWLRAAAGSPQLAVIWGRRRVGKTFLISHFVRKRRAVFFGATAQAETVELGRLYEAVRRDLGERAFDLAAGGFTSWEAALKFLAALAADEPLAVVIDEIPYLTESTPGFASIVQVVWDHLKRGTKLMLVLTGSAVSVIERILGESGALRGRPTLTMYLEPLEPLDARAFLPKLSASDYLAAYATCGGYPLHLKAWDASRTVEDNLLALAFSAGGILLDDAASMLAEELGGSSGYARILAAVGRGSSKYSEIASQAGQRVEQPLETLVRSGFLRRALPVGAPKAARPLYEIPDPYLAFWFGCLFASRSEIEGGQGKAALRQALPVYQRHLGAVFEELARAHARRLSETGMLPELLIGRWWAVSGEPCEVDVLGLSGSKVALIGEARLQDKPLDIRDLAALLAKSARVPGLAKNPTLAFWSRAGVTAAVKRQGALGFKLSEMLEG